MISETESIQEFIYKRTAGAKKNTLENTRELLSRLGDPQRDLETVHVAGTNGKGSVCAFCESILRENGFKTGLFTSPHLISMNERIKVNGRDVSDAELTAASERIEEALEEPGVLTPTFFEYMLLAALIIFEKEQVDIAVAEAGMGGLIDATNVLENKKAAVIASVGMDHTQYLGDAVEEIAAHKAGIMRRGVPCYYYAKGAAEDVILRAAADTGALPVKLSEDMMTEADRNPGQVDFFLSYGYHKICITITGDALYQKINASLAAMFAVDNGIDETVIRRGILNASRPARMEEMIPGFYIDGAHNVPAAAALAETLKRCFPDREKLFIYGASADKDIPGVMAVIKEIPGVKEIIFTRTGNPRMEDPERLMDMASDAGIGCNLKTLPVSDAVGEALRYIENGKDRMAVALGSFYLAGDVMKLLEEYK